MKLRPVAWWLILLALNPLARAEQRIFAPIQSVKGPVGVYMSADYHEYPQAIRIDFKTSNPGNDFESVFSNYFHCVFKGDKSAFVELHDQSHGDREWAESQLSSFAAFQPGVEVKRVDLIGRLNWGKLVVPLIDSDVTPRMAGIAPMIACYGDGCFRTRYPSLFHSIFQFISGIRGRNKKHWREITPDERAVFEQNKNRYLSYAIEPPLPQHQTPDEADRYPRVYLNLVPFEKRWRLPLDTDPELLEKVIPPEVRPVFKLFNLLARLDRNVEYDDEQLKDMFRKAFDHDRIEHEQWMIFRVGQDRYESRYVGFSRLADAVRRWSAIVPAGYLQHGDLKYIYYYPESEYAKLFKTTGESVIQIVPVRETATGHKIDFGAVPYTALGAIAYSETIELADRFFPRDAASPIPRADAEEIGINLVENASFERGLVPWQTDDAASWAQFGGLGGSGALFMNAPYYVHKPYIYKKNASTCLPVGNAGKFTAEAWFRYDSLPEESYGHRLELVWYEAADCSGGGQFGDFLQPKIQEGWQKLKKSSIAPALNAASVRLSLTQDQGISALIPRQKENFSNRNNEVSEPEPSRATAAGYWDNVSLIATEITKPRNFDSATASLPKLPPGQNYIENGDLNASGDGWRLSANMQWVSRGGYLDTGGLRSTLRSDGNSKRIGVFSQCVEFGAHRLYEMSIRFRRDPNSTQHGDGRFRPTWYENENCRGRSSASPEYTVPIPGADWQELKVTGLKPPSGSRSVRIELIQSIRGRANSRFTGTTRISAPLGSNKSG